MRGFRFRLEAPLRLAKVRRSELRRELAESLRELVELEACIERRIDERSQVRTELIRCTGAGIRGVELADATSVLDRFRSRLQALERQRRGIVEQQSSVKHELTAVSREVRVLERMRAEARSAEIKRRLGIEQRELDELALQRGAARLASRTDSRSDDR